MAEAKLSIRAVDEASSVMQNLKHNFEGLLTTFKTAVSFEALKQLTEALRGATEATVQFLESNATMARDLENLAAQSGISTRNLQVLQFAFKTSGVDVDALGTALKFLNRAIAQGDPTLAKLGVTSRDTFTALMQAARGLAAIADPADRANATLEVFGSRGGIKVVPVLLKLAAGFGAVAEKAELTNNVLNDKAIAGLDALHAALLGVQLRFEGLGKAVAVIASGPLSTFLTVMTAIADAVIAFEKLPILGKLGAIAGGEIRLPDQPKERLGPGNAEGIQSFLLWEAKQKEAAEAAAKALAELKAQIVGVALAERDVATKQRGVRKHSSLLKELQNTFKASGGKVDEGDFKLHLTDAGEATLRTAKAIGDALGLLRDSLFSGFQSVFVNLTNSMQTFGSAGKAIIDSMVQGILAAVGQLLASEAIKLLFKLLGFVIGGLTHNPALGSTIGMVGEAVTTGPVAGGGGNTFIIQTLSPRDVVGELLSPTGSMRGANSRLAEIAAAAG